MALSPQHAYYSEESTGDGIKKSPRWDNNEGVAATVGTIMSLLIFLTLFGMFTNQFVPVWMNDNESSHMSTTIQQFASIKSSIDLAVSNYANSLIAPAPVFVPVTLSSAGIPVFAAPTAGILSLLPMSLTTRPTFNITYTYYSGDEPNTLSPNNDGQSGGMLDLYCPNRYFVEQHLVYENGAIILNQTDGEYIVAGPQLSIKNMGDAASPSIVVMITYLSLYGTNVTVGGTGSKGVNADLQYAGTTAYQNLALSDLTIEIVSQHGTAWYNYFNRVLMTAGLVEGTHYDMDTPDLHEFATEALNYYTMTLVIHDVKVLDYTTANVLMSIGEIGV
jgi:hypothetical protein